MPTVTVQNWILRPATITMSYSSIYSRFITSIYQHELMHSNFKQVALLNSVVILHSACSKRSLKSALSYIALSMPWKAVFLLRWSLDQRHKLYRIIRFERNTRFYCRLSKQLLRCLNHPHCLLKLSRLARPNLKSNSWVKVMMEHLWPKALLPKASTPVP